MPFLNIVLHFHEKKGLNTPYSFNKSLCFYIISKFLKPKENACFF